MKTALARVWGLRKIKKLLAGASLGLGAADGATEASLAALDAQITATAVRGVAAAERMTFSALFQLCVDLARRPCVAHDGECLRCHTRCSCRACALEVQPWDFADPWHPALFEDRRSCHINEVRRATRKAQYYQLQCSDVRRDNTDGDIRSAVWAPVPDPRPRAGDPRAMFDAYGTTTCVVDESRPTQSVSSARAFPAWARWHRASCCACRVHAAAVAAVGATLRQDERGLCPGCYGRWMVNQVRAGFDPVFDYEPSRTDIPNHEPVYEEWPSTVAYLESLEKRAGVMSRRQHQRPSFHSPLLTIIRLMHRLKAADISRRLGADAPGAVPKGRVCLNVKASGLNEALQPWQFRYEDVHAAVRLVSGPRCFVLKLDIVKFFLELAASERLQGLLWFADPRFENEWRGRGPAPHRPGARRSEGKWRRFLTCIFGIKVLPAYANMLSGEICRYLRMLGVKRVTFLTDDFYIVAESKAEAMRYAQVALRLFAALGLESAPEKNEEGELLDFLGVSVDHRGELRPGWKRLDRLCALIKGVLAEPTASRDDLRSLAGVMTWQVLYLRGAAAFSRSLWDLVNWPGDGSVVPVSDAVRADATFWFAGVSARALSGSLMLLHGVSLRPLLVKSDGAGDGRWCYWHVTDASLGAVFWGCLPDASNVHVPYVELFAIFACVMMHGASWGNRIIVFGCDSAPICDALNKLTSPDPFLALLLRYVGAMQSVWRFDFVVEHCTRLQNTLADCGTRHTSMQDFRPFLEPEGFSDVVCAATPVRCRWSSPLSNAPIFAAPLGQCKRARWR